MNFTEAVRTCLRKYVTFSGRATRPEYWWFFLFILIGGVVTGILDGVLFGAGELEVTDDSVEAASNGPISALFSLGTLLPSLAVGWRRMHDTGRSGLYLLYPIFAIIGLASFIGMAGGVNAIGPMMGGLTGILVVVGAIVVMLSPFIVLWWLTRPTQPGQNAYGPMPEVSS